MSGAGRGSCRMEGGLCTVSRHLGMLRYVCGSCGTMVLAEAEQHALIVMTTYEKSRRT